MQVHHYFSDQYTFFEFQVSKSASAPHVVVIRLQLDAGEFGESALEHRHVPSRWGLPEAPARLPLKHVLEQEMKQQAYLCDC